MIDNLKALNDKINAFVDFVVRTACERTTSGNYFVSVEDAMKFAGMGYEDFLAHKDLILGELYERIEVLDFEFDESSMEFDVNCGLDYCPHYEWCEGDEEVFNCSYEEWLERPVLPVGQKAPEPVFYVGDGVYTDKEFSDFGSARNAFDMLTKHKLEDISLGVTLPGRGSEVLLYSYKGIEEVMIGASELKRLGLAMEIVDVLEAKRTALCPMNDLMVGKWRCHLVAPGDRYGLNNCLVHEGKSTKLEFWDMSVDKKKFPEGQFTWRYDVDGLMEDRFGSSPEVLMRHGLHLDLAVPAWTVTGDEMKRVFDWLKKRDLFPGERYLEVKFDIKAFNSSGWTMAEVDVYQLAGGSPLIRGFTVNDCEQFRDAHSNPGVKLSCSFTTQADKDTVKKELHKQFLGYQYEFSCEEKVWAQPALESVIENAEALGKAAAPSKAEVLREKDR